MIPTARIIKMAMAIQAYEGWSPTSLSCRNNNPGNLRRWGRVPVRNGFAVFPTYDAGWDALCTLLTRAASGHSRVYRSDESIRSFFDKYAPAGDDNHPNLYARYVAKRLGVPVTTPISWLLSTDPQTPPDNA